MGVSVKGVFDLGGEFVVLRVKVAGNFYLGQDHPAEYGRGRFKGS
jgi:hypothetical protein